MNILKSVGIWGGAMLFAGILWGANPARAVPIFTGELVANGEFGTNASLSLASWTISSSTGGGVNARPSRDAINTTGGNAGFNNFFDSAFAVLGDNSGAIGDDHDDHMGKFGISQDIVLQSALDDEPIKSYDLIISFRTVFDGRHIGNFADSFSASFGGIPLFTQSSSSGLPNCMSRAATCPNNQIVNNPFTTVLEGLAPGAYALRFSLLETRGAATNTAAGIDEVSIKGFANPLAIIPEPASLALLAIPEPASLALLGLGLIGLGLVRRRRT